MVTVQLPDRVLIKPANPHTLAQHTSGAFGVHTVGVGVAVAASANRLAVYGATGWSTMPPRDAEAVESLGVALRELLSASEDGTHLPLRCQIRG